MSCSSNHKSLVFPSSLSKSNWVAFLVKTKLWKQIGMNQIYHQFICDQKSHFMSTQLCNFFILPRVSSHFFDILSTNGPLLLHFIVHKSFLLYVILILLIFKVLKLKQFSKLDSKVTLSSKSISSLVLSQLPGASFSFTFYFNPYNSPWPWFWPLFLWLLTEVKLSRLFQIRLRIPHKLVRLFRTENNFRLPS